MSQDRVLSMLRAQRLHWVEVAPGVEVQFRRPLESELPRFNGGGVTVDHVCDYVVGWRGVTEATLLGDAVGASDEVPFTPELWREFVRDRIDLVRVVAGEIAARITAHLDAKAAATKNSVPYSTARPASS